MKPFLGFLFLLLITIGRACFASEAPIAVQTPALTKTEPVSLSDQKSGKIEYVVIDKDPSITLNNCSNITIYCSDVHTITLTSCSNISIQNCWIHDSAQVGINAWNCKNISVQGCRFERVASGFYPIESQGMQFVGNYAENVLGPFPRGQMVQFDKVTGAGNLIKNNYCVNYQGKSHPEDCINLFQSEGEPNSPILVEGNYLLGDPVKGSFGKSASGSGIMLGDNDEKGGGAGGHQVCRNNVVINAGQAGIGVAGGDAIRVENNFVIVAKSDVSNQGMYAWNQAKAPGGTVSFSNNRVYCIDKNGEPAGWWQGAGFAKVDLEGNQFDDQRLLSQPSPPPPSKAPFPPAPVLRGGVIQMPWK